MRFRRRASGLYAPEPARAFRPGTFSQLDRRVARGAGRRFAAGGGGGSFVWPELPAGGAWTEYLPNDFDGNNALATGWTSSGVSQDVSATPYVAGYINGVTDNTVPFGNNNIGRWWYPEGMADGVEPGAFDCRTESTKLPSGTTELVQRFVYRFSDPWTNHSVGTKLSFVWSLADTSGTKPMVFWLSTGGGSLGSIVPEWRTQPGDGSDTNYAPNVTGETTYSIVRGEWHAIVSHFVANTPGSDDGILNVWMWREGRQEWVKTHEYTDVRYLRATASDFGWLQVAPIYGGNTEETVPQDQTCDVAYWNAFYRQAA